jgi:hypothetical protein
MALLPLYILDQSFDEQELGQEREQMVVNAVVGLKTLS